MSDKKFKVNPGDEIIITVPGGNNQRNSSSVSHRTQKKGAMMPVPTPDEILGRRLRKKSLINFYDFGQIKIPDSEAFGDLPYSRSEFDSSANPDPSVVDSFNGWTQLRDYFLSIPTADWKRTFRKLSYEDAEKYGLEFSIGATAESRQLYPVARLGSRLDSQGNLVAGEHWTENGLKIDAPFSSFQVASFSAFVEFTVNDYQYNPENPVFNLFKITSAPNASAPDLTNSFQLAKRADIFLMPTITPRDSKHTVDLGSGNRAEKYILNHYGIYSREFWLGRAVAGKPYGVFNYANQNSNDDPIILTDGNKTDWTTWIKTNFPGTSGTQMETITGNHSTLSPSAFPENDYLSQYGFGLFQYGLPEYFGVIMKPGSLCGAIQQNGQTYYIWSKLNVNLAESLLVPASRVWTMKIGTPYIP